MFIIFMMLACESEEHLLYQEEVTSINSEKSYELLYFANEEELEGELKKVLKMKEEELIEWERKHNFKSFGIKADSIYNSFNITAETTLEDLQNFVENNKQYVQIIEDRNGEKIFETQLYNQARKYLINEDYIYQVGDEIYKLLKDGAVCVKESDIDFVKNNKNSIIDFNNEDVLTIIPNVLKSSLVNEPYNCGIDAWDDGECRKEKVELSISGYSTPSSYVNGQFTMLTHRAEYTARSYQKIVFWFLAKRNWVGDIHVDFRYTDESYEWTGQIKYDHYLSSYFNCNTVSDFEQMKVSYVPGYSYESRFHAIDAWAKQNECSDFAWITCNDDAV